MRSLLRILYQTATGLALLLAGPVLLVRRGGHYLPTLPGRLGLAAPAPSGEPASGPGSLWIHAVSVGEVAVAATLLPALPADLPLLVTTVTPTGQARARSLFAGRATVAYLPFDLGFAVRRFFRRFAPAALVLVEGDFWPLLLHEARQRGLPVAVINGRMSDRSFRRLRRRLAGPLLQPLLGGVDRFGVQSEEDRQKLLTLGVAPGKVIVTGNLKYESPAPQRRPGLEAAVAALAGGRPVLVAGSTMAGEEEAVLTAFAALRGGERALLVLAPRHPERWNDVERLLAARGLPFLRRSRIAQPSGPAPEPEAPKADTGARPAVLLLDSLGELAGLYALAAAAFVGGTLVATGGHNPLEPARCGVATAVGPSMDNFRDMAEQFDRAGAWQRVVGAESLAAAWRRWLDDPASARGPGERAARLVEENRGALGRTLSLLAPLLDRVGAAGSPNAPGQPVREAAGD